MANKKFDFFKTQYRINVKKIQNKKNDFLFHRLSKSYKNDYFIQRLCESYSFPNGIRRIYHVHIRKTGGTSLNQMFINHSEREPDNIYKELVKKDDHRVIANGLTYVAWNKEYINSGNYFYAFSHIPIHELDLPENTLKISIFRDPVKRVLSHYNMLKQYQINEINHPCMETEGKWLGDNINDFIDKIPPEHLKRQLFMFSEEMSVNEAFEKIISETYFFFTEDFAKGVEKLNSTLGINLEPIHDRKGQHKEVISSKEIDNLRELLEDEYELISKLKKYKLSL